MHIVELPCARAAARLSWVSSRSSGSSFESAYGTHAWVDALCLPENLEGLPRGLQDQRQAAIDSLRASLTEGRASRSELAPVRTSLSPGPPGSAPNSAASGPSSSQNGRTVAAPLGRVPLAGLDSNSNPGALPNGAGSVPRHLPAMHSENVARGSKGHDSHGKGLGLGRQPACRAGRVNVPESIPEAAVAPSASEDSLKSPFRNPFGPDVETDGDAVEGTIPRKPPSRVRPSMEARRKRLDLSALQASPVLSQSCIV